MSTETRPPRPASSSDDADAVLDRCCRFFDKIRSPVSDEIRAIRALPPPDRTVVVIGEVKRGKSSLVNALTGMPWAPVGVDITTSAYIRFEPPSDGLPPGTVRLHFRSDDYRLKIPIEELVEWVTVSGGRVRDAESAEQPIGATVAVESPLLPGITIVDTPGVNGLDPHHVETTLMAAEGESVMLMVCDATAPIAKPELEFLSQVTTEASGVVLAVTKIDQANTTFNRIVDENQRLLAQYAPRFADIDIVSVSSLYAQQAARIQDPKRRQRVLDNSGIEVLSSRLQDMLGNPRRAQNVRAALAAKAALDTLAGEMAVRRKIIEQSPKMVADMTHELARLNELKARRTKWAPKLTKDLRDLQIATESDIRHRLDQLKATWNDYIDKLSITTLHQSGQVVVAQMTADIEALTKAIGDDFRAGIQRIALPLLNEAQVGSELIDDAFRDVDYSLRPQGEYSARKGLADPQMLGIAMSGGPLLALTGAMNFVFPGGQLVAGALWAAVVVGFRATRGGKDSLRKWLDGALKSAREDLSPQVSRIMNQVPYELRRVYDERLDAVAADTQRLIDDAKEEARQSNEQRDQRLKDIQAALNDTNLLRAALKPHLSWRPGAALA